MKDYTIIFWDIQYKTDKSTNTKEQGRNYPVLFLLVRRYAFHKKNVTFK